MLLINIEIANMKYSIVSNILQSDVTRKIL